MEPSFFSGNRKALLNTISHDGVVVITGNGLMQRNNDCAYKFRQDSSFFYFTGLEIPGLTLVIDTKNAEEWIILPDQTEAETIFGGSINCDEVAKISSIENILKFKEGWLKLKELQKNRKKLFTISKPPSTMVVQERIFTSPARKILHQKLKRISNLPIVDISKEIIGLRAVKQPAEIEVIKNAIKITGQGFKLANEKLKPGVFEYQIEAEFDFIFKSNNCSHGYFPIIASGENSTILHHEKNNRQIKNNEVVMMDVGAELHNYSADISRSYYVGEPTERFNEVFQAVNETRGRAIKLLKPGTTWREYVLEVEKIIGEHLKNLGLISSVDRNQIRKYFPHAISHGLGLDVHDPTDYSAVMQEGMIVTVEPGIYIKNEKMGIRIEDNVLITNNGAKNLSDNIGY